MDVKYINAFIRSTKQVFADMVRVALTAQKPYGRRPTDPADAKVYQLSAVIGFNGSFSGNVVLSMPETVCLAIASGLEGAPVTKMNDGCYDAIAEVANMIAGGAKKEFSGTPVTLSIPKVMRTDVVTMPAGIPVLVIPFHTDSGEMLLQVSMKQRPAGAAGATAPVAKVPAGVKPPAAA